MQRPLNHHRRGGGVGLGRAFIVEMTPIYTSDNCTLAYQLRWSLTLFWTSPCHSDEWLPALRAATETDGVRILIRKASSAKGHLVSRIGIVPDHLHMTLGTHPDEAPRDVALSYMNNIAFAHGMNPVLMYGCYLAGFGEYDLGAIRDV